MHSMSEETARRIDSAVAKIVHDCLAKVRDILNTRRDALVALAEDLMVTESVDAVDLKRIIEDNSPGPRVVPGTANETKLESPGSMPEGPAEEGSSNVGG